jgi:hypothetical protein
MSNIQEIRDKRYYEGAVGVQTYGITWNRIEIRHASHKVCDGPEK